MMLREIAGFEWRYQLRQPVFFAACAVFAMLGFVVGRSGFAQANVAVNSPYAVMQATSLLSLMSVFVAAVFAANAVLRDVDHQMDGIVFTTAVGKFDYLFGRFCGAILATATVMFVSAVAMLAAHFVADPARRAPFSIVPYLMSFAIVTLPNVIFAAAVLFAIAALTRNALATYGGAVVLYFLYFATAALTNSPLMAGSKPGAAGGNPFLTLLDPFGMSAFFEVTRLWAAAMKNKLAVGTQGLILANRALWLGLSGATWLFVYRRFSFRIRARRVPREKNARAPKQRFRFSNVYLSLTAQSLRLLTSKPFVALLAVWIGLVATEIYSEILDTEYGAARYPATGLVLEAVRQPIEILGAILLIFYGAELYWREQRHRFVSILDATPVSSFTIVAAKATTLAMLIVSIIATGILPGVALQIVRGPQHIDVAAYLALFASAGVPLLVFAIAVLLINALSPGKYAGMVFSVLFLILTKQPSSIGLDHPLWQFGATPPVRHSEFGGFGYDLEPFAALAIHWLAVATLFLFIASALWRTRREIPKTAITIALLVSLGTGTWLFARIDASDRVQWKADYEKTYSRFAALPQPRIAAVDTKIDLFDRRVRVDGRYEIVNPSRSPISRVLIAVRREASDVRLQMAGARMSQDPRFGMYDLSLTQPLQPGARATVQFAATYSRALIDLEADDTIVPNGTFLMSFRILPSIGYRRGYEIDDPDERKKRGLPAARAEIIEGDVPADTEDIRFAATISTPIDETPIAPGVVERTWTEGNRRFTRYTQDRMRMFFAIASARYEVQKDPRGVALYYDAKHGMNARAMLDAAAETLAYCRTNFGPYRASSLKMAEVPSWSDFGALATPNTIFLTEHRTFLIDRRDPNRPDLLARRIAHEVAHQWWGYEVAPGSSPGSTFIVESLAKYTELAVLEKMHGRAHVRQLLDVDRDRYLAGRARDHRAEVPLLSVANQSHIYYGKGAVVLFAIRDLVGEQALNSALRAFVAEQSSRHGFTRATDLLPHLRRIANDEQYSLMEQWLGEIVLYDLSIASARQERGSITVRVLARKVRADGDGNESPLPMREAIAIRVTDANGETLYERKHVLDGDDVLTIPVAGEPQFVEIDPWLTRIDKNLNNNEVRLE
jgi:ABC-2 type transport system permease protein